MSNIEKIQQNVLSVQTHWIQCLTEDDRDKTMEILDKESSLTIGKCLEFPLIADVQKSIPRKFLLKAVREIVLNTALSFKYSEKMDLGQATLLASDLIERFKSETLEDIVQMFKMARLGLLGSGKGRLDSDVVFNVFVPAYLDLKAEEREKQYLKEKQSFKNFSGEMSEDSRKKFEELAQKLSANRENQVNELKPIVNHHQIWINRLRNSVSTLKDEDLYSERKKAEKSDVSVFGDAVKIYDEEIARRNADRK